MAGADTAPVEPEPDEPAVPQVQGVICARGHFNDPNSPFCATCGISMVQQTHNLVEGPRPPLGVLVLDDGSTYVVDRDIVVGREPDTDAGVAAGDVRGIALPDPERAISRVHARVTLHGWEVRVADAGSANGTFVATRDATQWTPVAPNAPVTLTPGMHVLVGPRVLSFDSHRRS
jgi:pSer/pThr/pTyr-binding forkhead associated (FHA) protein